jgi:VWFA-related protein
LLRVAATFLAFLFSCSSLPAQQGSIQAQSSSEGNSKPSAVVDLSATDFRPQTRAQRLEDNVSGSLDFIDDNHLLVTFDPRELFKRHADCPKSHQDRLMRALVLELPGGKVVKETTWYLHDRRRYVWPLGTGQFLLRRLNTLYVVDSALKEKVLLESPSKLLWVAVTPDQKQIIIEAQEASQQNSAQVASLSPGKKKPTFLVQFLDENTLAPQRTLKLDAMVKLDATSTGYADLQNKDDLWLVRYGTSPEDRRNVTVVRSKGEPRVFYSGDNSLLIGRCCSSEGDYSVSSFTTSGHWLWRQHWSRPRYLPVVAYSRDRGRFAVSTLMRQPDSATADTSEEDDANGGLEQNVQVFETASGTLLRSLPVNPAVISGQNFSLSPDARRLAVFAGSVIHIYDLPPASPEEESKLAALKADVPELHLGSNDGTQSPLVQARDEAPVKAPVPATPAAPSAAAATSQEAGSAPTPTFTASTRAVVVDVVATDGKGHTVKGLRKDDFALTEDGKPQDIGYFREVNDTAAAQAQDPASSTTPKQAENLYSNTAQASEPGAVMMILLDLLNTPSADQQYAREGLLRFLKTRTAKTSQFALCALTGDPNSPLRLVQGFTPDENVLLSALNSQKGARRSVRWEAAAQSTQTAVNAVAGLASYDSRGWGDLLRGLEVSQAIQQETDTDARVTATTNAMIQLANYLSGIPGRKSLVWLSGSFPISFAAGMNSQTGATSNRNYARLVQRVSNLLAQSQVAVYPVDVRGVGGDNVVAATEAGSSGTPASEAAPNAITMYLANEAPVMPMQQQAGALSARTAERNAMAQIASATGGKPSTTRTR